MNLLIKKDSKYKIRKHIILMTFAYSLNEDLFTINADNVIGLDLQHKN